MMNKIIAVLLVSLICISENASAYLMYGNSRIDQALYHESDTRLIVHATITKVYKRVPLDSTQIYFFDGPEVRNMDVHVNKVILGKTQFESATLHIPVSSFMWPDDLVTQQADHELLLILRQDYADSNAFSIEVVIPCISGSFESVSDKEAAKKMLAKELVKVVRVSAGVQQQRAVLKQLGPILLAENADAMVPYLSHEDVWVKRAAIAALVYATEDPDVIRLAAEDIQQFISTTPKDSLLKEIHPGYHYAPYPFYKEYMFFAQSYCWRQGNNWSPEQTEKDCRIVEKMLTLGVLDKKTLRILENEF